MIKAILSYFLLFFRSKNQLHVEVLCLRKQLEIVARRAPRPRLRPSDRFLFGILPDLSSSWKEALLIIKPETVIRWHRQGFAL